MPVSAYKEPSMQENGLNSFRTIFSEVSSFVGNPVLHCRVSCFDVLTFLHLIILIYFQGLILDELIRVYSWVVAEAIKAGAEEAEEIILDHTPPLPCLDQRRIIISNQTNILSLNLIISRLGLRRFHSGFRRSPRHHRWFTADILFKTEVTISTRTDPSGAILTH